MARIIDLDARRIARAETWGEPTGFILGGETFTLPVEVPLESLDLMAEGKFREAVAILLDDEQEMQRMFKHRPTNGDLEEIMSVYGESGESLGSPSSSLNGGSQRKPTGKATTTATSRRTATAPTTSVPASS